MDCFICVCSALSDSLNSHCSPKRRGSTAIFVTVNEVVPRHYIFFSSLEPSFLCFYYSSILSYLDETWQFASYKAKSKVSFFSSIHLLLGRSFLVVPNILSMTVFCGLGVTELCGQNDWTCFWMYISSVLMLLQQSSWWCHFLLCLFFVTFRISIKHLISVVISFLLSSTISVYVRNW